MAGVLLLPERALPSQPWHVRIINVSHGFVPGASVYVVSARHRSCRIVVRRIQLALRTLQKSEALKHTGRSELRDSDLRRNLDNSIFVESAKRYGILFQEGIPNDLGTLAHAKTTYLQPASHFSSPFVPGLQGVTLLNSIPQQGSLDPEFGVSVSQKSDAHDVV